MRTLALFAVLVACSVPGVYAEPFLGFHTVADPDDLGDPTAVGINTGIRWRQALPTDHTVRVMNWPDWPEGSTVPTVEIRNEVKAAAETQALDVESTIVGIEPVEQEPETVEHLDETGELPPTAWWGPAADLIKYLAQDWKGVVVLALLIGGALLYRRRRRKPAEVQDAS